MKVTVSWSGGKDSCLACYKAKEEGFEVQNLLIMMNNKGQSSFHLIPSDLLDAQSNAVEIPTTKRNATTETYEQEFKKTLKQMKAQGVEGVVTGDIFEVSQHEIGWLERISRETDMKPIRPLWRRSTKEILNEFLRLGFKAIVVRVRTDLLGAEFLGRQVDEEFCAELVKLGNVDPCGERGEYHTFVTDGPLFKKRIEILETRKSTQNGSGKLEITHFQLKPKGL